MLRMNNLFLVAKGELKDIGLRKKHRSFLYQIVAAFFSKVALAILMFFFIYNLSFSAVPSLTTGRLTILLLTGLMFTRVFIESRQFLRANLVVLFVFGFMLAHSFLLYILTGGVDSTQLSRSFHFMCYSIFGSLLFSTLLNQNLYMFLSVFSLATLIQSLFIFYSYLSPEYRLWLSELLVQSGNIPLVFGGQVPGFSNSSGAFLSLTQALGVFSALYAARVSKSAIPNYFYGFSSLIIMASIILTGRMGILLASAFLILFLIANVTQRKRFMILNVATIALLIIFLFGSRLYSIVYDYNPQVESQINWAFEFYQHGTEAHSLKDLASQPIPPLSLETILGTGLVAGIDGLGNASGNDSGYVQTYYALGLIMAFMFYGTLLFFLLKYTYRSRDRFLLGSLVLLMFVVELKEPFIFKYVYPFFALSVIYLSSKQKDSIELPKYKTQDLLPDL